jgi:hypothetical protein
MTASRRRSLPFEPILRSGGVRFGRVSQAPIFWDTAGARSFLQYEAVLGNGLIIHGTAVIERNPDRSVPRVSVTFSPLGAALSLAGRLGALLDKDLGEGLFL